MDATTYTIDREPLDADGTLTIRVAGSVETTSSQAFQKDVLAIVATPPSPRHVRMDCSGMRYASSTGVGAICEIMMELKKRNIDFVLLSVPPNLRQVINLLGFSAFLTIEG